jgi:hypothetical protein
VNESRLRLDCHALLGEGEGGMLMFDWYLPSALAYDERFR